MIYINMTLDMSQGTLVECCQHCKSIDVSTECPSRRRFICQLAPFVPNLGLRQTSTKENLSSMPRDATTQETEFSYTALANNIM
jgi:hypothetical protein